jgi:hypothetical protein
MADRCTSAGRERVELSRIQGATPGASVPTVPFGPLCGRHEAITRRATNQ